MIPKPTPDDTARALTLPGWEWADGMLATYKTSRARIWFDEGAHDPDGPTTHPRTGRAGRWRIGDGYLWRLWSVSGCLPDIDDPATAGCLFALLIRDGESFPSPPEGEMGDGWTLGEVAVWIALQRGYWVRP